MESPKDHLFVLYVSKLFRIVEKYLPDAHAFANDLQLYVLFKPDSTCDQLAAVAALEHCIDDIRDWMLSDKLKINDGKTEFLHRINFTPCCTPSASVSC